VLIVARDGRRITGLLEELRDASAVRRSLDDPELVRERLRHPDARHRHSSTALDMRADHLHRIHAVDVVGSEDDDVLGLLVIDEVEALEDGIRRAGVPARTEALLSRHRGHVVAQQGRHAPRLRDVAVQAVRLVLGEDAHSA
jgi:hypothetical protein